MCAYVEGLFNYTFMTFTLRRGYRQGCKILAELHVRTQKFLGYLVRPYGVFFALYLPAYTAGFSDTFL